MWTSKKKVASADGATAAAAGTAAPSPLDTLPPIDIVGTPLAGKRAPPRRANSSSSSSSAVAVAPPVPSSAATAVNKKQQQQAPTPVVAPAADSEAHDNDNDEENEDDDAERGSVMNIRELADEQNLSDDEHTAPVVVVPVAAAVNKKPAPKKAAKVPAHSMVNGTPVPIPVAPADKPAANGAPKKRTPPSRNSATPVAPPAPTSAPITLPPRVPAAPKRAPTKKAAAVAAPASATAPAPAPAKPTKTAPSRARASASSATTITTSSKAAPRAEPSDETSGTASRKRKREDTVTKKKLQAEAIQDFAARVDVNHPTVLRTAVQDEAHNKVKYGLMTNDSIVGMYLTSQGLYPQASVVDQRKGRVYETLRHYAEVGAESLSNRTIRTSFEKFTTKQSNSGYEAMSAAGLAGDHVFQCAFRKQTNDVKLIGTTQLHRALQTFSLFKLIDVLKVIKEYGSDKCFVSSFKPSDEQRALVDSLGSALPSVEKLNMFDVRVTDQLVFLTRLVASGVEAKDFVAYVPLEGNDDVSGEVADTAPPANKRVKITA
jgi:hypothetical protein